MKLKFERFEGLSCFSVRGPVQAAHLRILQVGVETILKDLQETLCINLTQALIEEKEVAALIEMKKSPTLISTQKVFWVTKTKVLGDFPTIEVFASRLSGFKHRQVGDRIRLDDDIYALQFEIQDLEKKIVDLGGDQDRAWKIILENRICKEQDRILRQSNKWQNSRMSAQAIVPPADPDTVEENNARIVEILAELKKAYGSDIDL